MGPLIDTELEKIDRKHMTIMELNQKLVDALQMYHSLMKMPPMAGGKKRRERVFDRARIWTRISVLVCLERILPS